MLRAQRRSRQRRRRLDGLWAIRDQSVVRRCNDQQSVQGRTHSWPERGSTIRRVRRRKSSGTQARRVVVGSGSVAFRRSPGVAVSQMAARSELGVWSLWCHALYWAAEMESAGG
ncbi:hypothetical protein N657DRAFT_449604 [Parathielavia appendiculata]|uniref:Uncharacterized protein n=1 Tax=Parathielavia appendiculata TaxID=2587402 RepID=A0AAN6TYR1_9PEZI|nr:hypothetical protein N657DRAFT_449604 [Parathielavia appendiculata]